MAVPWLQILDTVLDLTALARRRPSRAAEPPNEQLAAGSRAVGQLETRLAGVVVAALKEAFDRDSRRLEFEREQQERERERAERLLKLELARQTGEREIGRLRLLAGISVASWIGTLFFIGRLTTASTGARVAVGIGWLLLLASLALSFAAQGRISQALGTIGAANPSNDVTAGAQGAIAGALIVGSLAVIGLAVLVG
jgi:hypothetical protein